MVRRKKAGGRRAVGRGLVVAGLVVAAGRQPAAPAAATIAAAASASTLYQEALATTHSWSVHYDSTSTESKVTLVESGDAGPASASQTVTHGQGHHLPSSSSAASPTSRATPTASRAWPASARPRRPRPPASGSSSRPTTPPSPRWSTASAPGRGQGAGAQGPALPRARPHARRQAVDAIDGTQTLRQEVPARRALRPRHGTHVPVEEDSVERQGAAHRRPSTSSTPSGASGCGPRRPRRTISVGSDKRRLRKQARRPRPRPGDVGRYAVRHPGPSRRSLRRRAGPPGE